MKLYLSPPTGFPPQLNGEKYILPSQIGKTLDTKCASESKKNKKIPERPHELEVSLHSRPDILVPDFLNVQCGPKVNQRQITLGLEQQIYTSSDIFCKRCCPRWRHLEGLSSIRPRKSNIWHKCCLKIFLGFAENLQQNTLQTIKDNFNFHQTADIAIFLFVNFM